MKKISILTCLALFAATLTQQGAAWAQGSHTQNSQTDNEDKDWGQVPTVTSEWTHITAGSTTGFELKNDNYYVSENLTFTNIIGGAGQGSGMYVQAGKTVYLYIPAGVTLTVKGADASGTTGGGAGILLPSTSTLHIIGGGTLVATGGNAADGAAGGAGTDAIFISEDDDKDPNTWIFGDKIIVGRGGYGGDGGGGAGAGIGTAGGNGGAGAEMLAADDEKVPASHIDWTGGDLAGRAGDPGSAGNAAVQDVGKLYIQNTITLSISGGEKGKGGARGTIGKGKFTGGDIEFTGIDLVNIGGVPIPIPTFDVTDKQAVAGGGGGGGGAGGGSAYAIGTGGAGGGGGGAGACGSARAHNSWTNDNFGSVGAGGGAGGAGSEDNSGATGGSYWFVGDDNIFDAEENHKPGGTGGAAGTPVSVAGSDGVTATPYYGVATAPTYTVSYYAVGTTPMKNNVACSSETYSVGSSTTITLPSLSGGDKDYKWILSIHGRAAGNTTSHCAAPNGDVYDPGATVNLSNIYGAIEFCAVYVGCDIDCTDHVNQYWKTALTNYTAGEYAVVKLTNRKLYRDGYWNTLTLPFSLSAEKLAETCLAGADIRTFKSTAWVNENQRLTINFSESNEGKIDAGVPCIIRWGTPGNAPGDSIVNPLFTNVPVTITNQNVFEDDIENTDNIYEITSNGVRFQALIAPVEVTVAESASTPTLLLGSNNRLYRPKSDVWVRATHAYFTYPSNIDAEVRSITMDFGDEQTTTYIDDIRVNDSRETNVKGIFNLNGQRLDAPRKGLNIINGKKVMVK